MQNGLDFSSDRQGLEAALVSLFADTFTASEGAAEGGCIGALVQQLLSSTAADDLSVQMADVDGVLAGALCFTRLRYPQDSRTVFLMAPVAVATTHQRRGIGQQLIRHGLAALAGLKVDVVMTYGDPAFYGKTGFRPIRVGDAAPPWPLTQPEGWLAQALAGEPLAPLAGPAYCVSALNDPAYW